MAIKYFTCYMKDTVDPITAKFLPTQHFAKKKKKEKIFLRLAPTLT